MTTTTQTPYKGLAPYEQEDQNNFFGRQQEKAILLGKILAHKLTLLYAATGVGKTSLLRAAVIPELQDLHHENLDVIYYRNWSIEDPLVAIKTETCKTLRERKKIAAEDLHKLRGETLQQFFEHCQTYASKPFIVIFDQFEEVFTQYAVRHALEFDHFIEQLVAVMTAEEQEVHLVLAMREDFLAELSVFRGNVPNLYNNYYRLTKLTPPQAREAIENPVKAFGFEYEPELLKNLLRDLVEQESRDPYNLSLTTRLRQFVESPYLQIVCQELWRKEQDNPTQKLRLKTYQDLGGADQIVQNYIKNIMAGLTPAQQLLASRAFTLLVTEQGTKMAYPVATLAKMLKVEMAILQPILDKLTQSRILRDEKRPGGHFWYELYHDVFTRIIGQWNEKYLEQKRRQKLLGIIVSVVGLMVIVGMASYELYKLQKRIALNLGTLQVINPEPATLTLTRLRQFYQEPAKQEENLSFPLRETTISLTGPADYLLTVQNSQATSQYPNGYEVKYPIFIAGFNHTVEITVTPPPIPPEEMVYIPAGVFRIGDKDDRDGIGNADELPAHDVYLDGYFMDKTEVTNRQYQSFVAAGGYTQANYWSKMGWEWLQKEPLTNNQYREDEKFNSPEQPVVGVSWYEAEAFCRWQNKRLPIEAEWEKAAAGPEGYKWFVSNDDSVLKHQMNFCDNHCDASWADKEVDDGYKYTAPVGSYQANGYHLYDMSGNVWEWVADGYDKQFYGTPQATANNPRNLVANSSQERVLRGGAWLSPYYFARVSLRHPAKPTERQLYYGFRCARSLPLPSGP
jgi:formylglycine-generating enzyme required for sulfatase activity